MKSRTYSMLNVYFQHAVSVIFKVNAFTLSHQFGINSISVKDIPQTSVIPCIEMVVFMILHLCKCVHDMQYHDSDIHCNIQTVTLFDLWLYTFWLCMHTLPTEYQWVDSSLFVFSPLPGEGNKGWQIDNFVKKHWFKDISHECYNAYSLFFEIKQNIDQQGNADVIVHLTAEYQATMMLGCLQLRQWDGHFAIK